MRKDFKYKTLNDNTFTTLKWGWIVFILLLAGFMVSLFVAGYQDKKNNLSLFANFKQWATLHKEASVQKVVKPVAKNNELADAIHFEFYTALPNMKIAAVSSGGALAKAIDVKNPKALVTPTPIVSVEELEQALSKENMPEGYIVQLGLFKQASSATQYRDTLIDSGLVARIEKILMGDKTFYRVQLGPFAEKKQAKNEQKELQGKGIAGIVLKSTS